MYGSENACWQGPNEDNSHSGKKPFILGSTAGQLSNHYSYKYNLLQSPSPPCLGKGPGRVFLGLPLLRRGAKGLDDGP
ncbi:hypothetical protein TNCV_2311601 [Trichonephila clavipes]|nr:hypothetical protein TNCV_2311601 [Trichonephila clavipes]